MNEIIIENGTLPSGEICDVAIAGEKIASIGKPSQRSDGMTIIDASDCFVFPGGIDPHTHVNLKIGDSRVIDGWSAATRAAALGGTTCLIEHPSFGVKLECAIDEANGNSYIDYGFHAAFEPSTPSGEIPRMIKLGVTSGKVYMTYSGRLNDENFFATLAEMKKIGGLTAVHAENHTIITELTKKYCKIAPNSPLSHALSRPDYCEAEAVSRAISLARAADAPLYIVHVSTRKGLEIIRAARGENLRVHAETCPQYLLWTEEKYTLENGMDFIMAPPLRKQHDCDALWEGLADGTIDTIGSDHCNFVRSGHDVFGSLGGVAGIGERMTQIFKHGVLKNRISPAKFASLVSTAPAKIFGIQNKGELKEGFDADITIMNKKTGEIPFVLLRGAPPVEETHETHKKRGKFIARRTYA